jgi:iron(III) transport system permease protein
MAHPTNESTPRQQPKGRHDDWIMRGGMVVIGVYLVVTLAFPLAAMLARSVHNGAGEFVGLSNYRAYFGTPTLVSSIANSLLVAGVSTVLTVPLAFVYAYALQRSCMPCKGLFKTVALVPMLVPSLLSGLALVYLFGKQGLLQALLFGAPIYGPLGIVMAEVFFTFPHALLILLAALSLADARLYEAATVLRASRMQIFRTVTLPGTRYGLASAAAVVFTLVFTDFGAPKVIGGRFNVLAVDLYKQVIGQQNFAMGAVVSVLLLIPAVVAFFVERLLQKRQVALLSVRAVPFLPTPHRRFDACMLGFCIAVSVFLVGILLTCQFAALVAFYPYDLRLNWQHYSFNVLHGGGYVAYGNSLRLAFCSMAVGTPIVFIGAYLIEKGRSFTAGRAGVHCLTMMPMAVPGVVLGLSYILFFNHPSNPLRFLYNTRALLIICTITHFYTVAHIIALTALKQMDAAFEAVSASLKQPFYTLLLRVTVPVCLPALLDIAIYLFITAMTTVSAVVFLYGPDTPLASIAVLRMDDAGDIAPAAAMGMIIFYTNAGARLVHVVLTQMLDRHTQAWRRH